MKLPIGYDNFGEIRAKKLDFVDKTRFIQAILDEITTQVIVITRPRRFGKTLNLSMLQHFLVAEVYGRKTQQLFEGLYITTVKEQLEQLLAGQPITTLVDENIVFGDLERNHNALWNLMLFSGYVKVIASEPSDAYVKVQLLPPNYEVFLLYRSMIQDWFSAPLGQTNYENFLK